MDEHDLSKQFSSFLEGLAKRRAPLWFLKVHGDRWQRAGIPDYLLCIGGHFVAVELKHPAENPTAAPLQAVELRWLRRAGATTRVLNDLDACKSLVLQCLARVGWWP